MLICVIFWIPHISNIIWCLSFSFWLTSFSRIISGSICVAVCVCCVFSNLVVFNSLWPHGLQPARLLCPWGFSTQEYWGGLPCPPPGVLPDPEIEPKFPALQVDSSPSEPPGRPENTGMGSQPIPSPGHLPDPGIKLGSPALQADSLPSELRQFLVNGLWHFMLI